MLSHAYRSLEVARVGSRSASDLEGVLLHSQQSTGVALVLSGENTRPCLLPHHSIQQRKPFLWGFRAVVFFPCWLLLGSPLTAQVVADDPGLVHSIFRATPPSCPRAPFEDVWLPFTSSSSVGKMSTFRGLACLPDRTLPTIFSSTYLGVLV